MVRRGVLLVAAAGIAGAGACSDSSGPVGKLRHDYALETASDSGLTLTQDATYSLGVVLVRDGSDTIPSPSLSYVVDDYDVAAVNASGVVTAKRGGSTTIRAAVHGDTVVIPITVVPRPVTSIELTVNHTGQGTATRFAYPGDGRTAFLKAVVKVGNDTVYCNALACTNHATRAQRLVQFESLDTTKATVSNASGTAAQLNIRGQVTARDTSADPVGIVLKVSTDSGVAPTWADTVFLRFTLRPVDSLVVRPDSFLPVGSTTKIAYTSAVVADSSILLGVTMQNRRDSSYTLSTAGAPTKSAVTINVARPTPPSIIWESANPNYAVVDNQGRVTGVRATWLPSTMPRPAADPALPAWVPARVGTDVPACINQVFRTTTLDVAYWYDKVLTEFPIPATGPWVVPTNGWRDTLATPTEAVTNDMMELCPSSSGVPTTVARGVNCNTQVVGTPGAYCNVVIRATLIDPATGATKRAHFIVTVRNP